MAIVIIRTLIIYTSIFTVMRLLGKRQLGEMEVSEFVIAALIADLAANTLQDTGVPLLNGVVPVITLFCLEVIVSALGMKSIRLRSVLFGKPSLLIHRGKIDQREMKKNRFTLDELMEQLRAQGLNDISKIEFAVLETSGNLTVIPYPEHQPVSASLLGISPPDKGYSYIIINEGRIMNENLRRAGYDIGWLQKKLREQKLRSAEEVYFMTVNKLGEVYFSLRGESV